MSAYNPANLSAAGITTVEQGLAYFALLQSEIAGSTNILIASDQSRASTRLDLFPNHRNEYFLQGIFYLPLAADWRTQNTSAFWLNTSEIVQVAVPSGY